MNSYFLLTIIIITGYLIGGIPFGYMIGRFRGVDIFKEGSGNIGATNVGRVLGKKYGILVLLLDFAKGALPVILATNLPVNYYQTINSGEFGVAAGLAAILGHTFSIYLGFRGGKGVATGAGVIFFLLPIIALISLVVWIGFVLAFRYISVGSLASAISLLITRFLITSLPFARPNLVTTIFCLAVAGLVFVRHRGNIKRLFQGTENRLQGTQTMLKLTKAIHVLSMGLWFGTIIFFSFVVGLTMFNTMQDITHSTKSYPWFQVPSTFASATDPIDGPYEYGVRIAGTLISPMFLWYFLIQGFCGFLALASCWSWQSQFPHQKIHRWRFTILALAFATVVLGWPIERTVHDLRAVRHEKMDQYFAAGQSSKEELQKEALEAKADFGRWHGYSLLLNFATIALVTVGMGMAGFLPNSRDEQGKEDTEVVIRAPKQSEHIEKAE